LKLREISIKNFKSIEDVTIEKIGDIDVFCGRNNSGKTSIFEALTKIQSCKIHPTISNVEVEEKFFTGKKSKTKVMNIMLTFELDDEERHEGIESYYSQIEPDFLNSLIKGQFLKKIEYTFESFKGTRAFGLHSIRISEHTGEFGLAAIRLEGNRFKVIKIGSFLKKFQNSSTHKLEKDGYANIQLNEVSSHEYAFLFQHFDQFINGIYTFSPFRRSQEIMPAVTDSKLANDGSNLVQRIYTMKQNEDQNWEQLRDFVNTALPDLGDLHSRVKGKSNTVAVVKDKKWNIEIDIHDMGSGIEQLLIIACFLISESRDSLVLIENPEHHLHPGAQRILLQYIHNNLKSNQVLITTHSPIFLSQKDLSIHVVAKGQNGTKIKKIEELEELSTALNELGSRNSDLLLSDSALFVEGPSDEKILRVWATAHKLDFPSKAISCIHMGGSRNFHYYANSDVLKRISLKSPIPHLFIIDKDEKSEDTIKKIKAQVENLHILERREIENYLLNPRAIIKAMKIKAGQSPRILEKLSGVKEKEVNYLISSEVENQKDTVLLKRIKEQIGGGVFLSDDVVDCIIDENSNLDTVTLVNQLDIAINNKIKEMCGKKIIKNIVERQSAIFDKLWSSKSRKKSQLVSGKRVLQGIFDKFGLKYDAVKDGVRVAEQMGLADIDPEINSIIDKIKALVN